VENLHEKQLPSEVNDSRIHEGEVDSVNQTNDDPFSPNHDELIPARPISEVAFIEIGNSWE